MAFSEQVETVIRWLVSYGGIVPLVLMLFRFSNTLIWWLFFGFMIGDSIVGAWLNYTAQQGINNWYLIDAFSPITFAFMGLLLVRVPKPNKVLFVAYVAVLLTLIVSLLFKSPDAHWNLHIEHLAYVVFGGIAILKMIQEDNPGELVKHGVFWIVLAQFLFQLIQLSITAVYQWVDLPHEEFWSQFLMQSFQISIILYFACFTFGVWNFRKA